LSPIRCGGAPSGAAAFIVSDGKMGNNFRIISEYYDFHRISSLFNYILWGLPATVAASLVISAENRFRVVCYF
jgi:predicted oxidoreductase